MSRQILLATHNPHKREELQKVLETELSTRVEVITLDDVTPPVGEIPETGATLHENAFIKAKAVYTLTRHACLADDTGLEVDALGGAPGVYSARYAGEDASYDDNVKKLLEALRDERDRSARFRTVLCFFNGGQPHYFEGTVEGTISEERVGNAGFGYDPIFIPAGETRSFAEMTSDEKNAISHRGRALRVFATWLQSNT